MTNMGHEHRHFDVVCDLRGDRVADQVDEWRELAGAALDVDLIPGGARLWLRPEARVMTEELVRREAQCCGFLDFDVRADGDRLRLDVTSAAAEGAEVARFLAGFESGQSPPSA